jgi:hypothetical protein
MTVRLQAVPACGPDDANRCVMRNPARGCTMWPPHRSEAPRAILAAVASRTSPLAVIVCAASKYLERQQRAA